MTAAKATAATKKAAAPKEALDAPDEDRDESAPPLPCVDVQLGSCPNSTCPLHLHIDQVAGREDALAPPV